MNTRNKNLLSHLSLAIAATIAVSSCSNRNRRSFSLPQGLGAGQQSTSNFGQGQQQPQQTQPAATPPAPAPAPTPSAPQKTVDYKEVAVKKPSFARLQTIYQNINTLQAKLDELTANELLRLKSDSSSFLELKLTEFMSANPVSASTGKNIILNDEIILHTYEPDDAGISAAVAKMNDAEKIQFRADTNVALLQVFTLITNTKVLAQDIKKSNSDAEIKAQFGESTMKKLSDLALLEPNCWMNFYRGVLTNLQTLLDAKLAPPAT